MSGIFISYRRGGASKAAYRLKDRLKDSFGPDKVFVDVEDIEPGLPFDEIIRKAISRCSIALVVIGPDWLDMTDEEGQRRLANPDDWVRQEVEIAMASDIRVIPLLVDDASNPDPARLPASLQPFARLQTRTLANDEVHWNYDVDRLVELLARIDPHLARPEPSPEPAKVPFSGKLITALVILGIVVFGVETPDADTAVGAIALGMTGLVFAIWAYLDIRAGRTRGRGWAIAGIALGVLGTLAGIGLIGKTTPQAGPGPDDVSRDARPPADDSMAALPISSPQAYTVTGTWRSGTGNFYRLIQSGPTIRFIGADAVGVIMTSGTGRLLGRRLEVQFTTTDSTNATGSGRFLLSEDSQRLQGTVHYQPSGLAEMVILDRQ